MTGYEVANLSDALSKAKAAGVSVLVDPYKAGDRNAAMVQFPGGYIAEIHGTDGDSPLLSIGPVAGAVV
jgi:hypothetical protein